MISIALTTYNGERFLREQIDSILGQRVSDIELVVCDDGSTDGTWAILSDYHKKDNRVYIYQNEHTLGFRDNFLKAISLCKGDYIALCDQDDIWTPNHLELLLKAIGDNMLVCGNSELVDENNKSLCMTLLEQEGIVHLPKNSLDVALLVMLNHNPFQGAAMLFRREFIEYALPLPEQADYHDVWFAALSSLMDSFVYVNTPIVRYRMHGDNISGGHERRDPKTAVRRLLRSHYWPNRPALLTAIEQRGVLTSKTQKRYANAMKRYFHNARCKYTKVFNFPFIIAHFKSITAQ